MSAISLIQSVKEIARQVRLTPTLLKNDWDYDDYWQAKRGKQLGATNLYQEARAEWIAARVSPGDSVLDLGCGDGATLSAIRRRVNIQATGADVSEDALSFIGQQGIATHLCDLGNPEAIAALPETDHILLLEVLEHVVNSEELLLSVLPKARKSVFFSFPNTGYLSYRLRMICGRFPVQWRVHPSEHVRFWTYRDMKWWLRELKIHDRTTTDVYLGVPGLNRVYPSLCGAGLIAQVTTCRDGS